MNITLFGIKGCGKTTFGRMLAQKLKRAFIDTDHLIQEMYQHTYHKKLTCREIYELVGDEGFRSLEYEVIQSLQDVQHSVIAVGGGTMLLYENIEALQKNSHLIYLFLEKHPLKIRVLSLDPLPIFLDSNDPETSFDRIYDERDDFYRNLNPPLLEITHMKDHDVICLLCKFLTKDIK